jgi:hypothetical protein
VDEAGLAALQIHNWVLVFEDVPAKSVPAGFNTANSWTDGLVPYIIPSGGMLCRRTN